MSDYTTKLANSMKNTADGIMKEIMESNRKAMIPRYEIRLHKRGDRYCVVEIRGHNDYFTKEVAKGLTREEANAMCKLFEATKET